MITPFSLAVALAAAPVAAQAPPEIQLDPGQQTALRCSAAFAIVAADQARGMASALAFPPLGKRGREYFVKTGARLIDETGATRAQLQAWFVREGIVVRQNMGSAQNQQAAMSALMTPCLALLDQTVPPDARRAP